MQKLFRAKCNNDIDIIVIIIMLFRTKCNNYTDDCKNNNAKTI